VWGGDGADGGWSIQGAGHQSGRVGLSGHRHDHAEQQHHIVWQTGSTSRGICMTAGTSFAASYVLNGKVGMVLYELQPDGSMKGIWTVADQPGSGTENLSPAR
jgi:hypothetical protein